MSVIVRKDGNRYLTNNNQSIPENAWEVLPYLQKHAGKYFWLLIKALLDVDRRCYLVRGNRGVPEQNLERDFCAHILGIWESLSKDFNNELMVNGDILKSIPEIIYPDLALNIREGDCQEVVVEVKRDVQQTSSEKIFKDLDKLSNLTNGVYSPEYGYNVIGGRYHPYAIGVFVFICGDFRRLKSKFRYKRNELIQYVNNLGELSNRIFCVCSPGDGSLEYATLSEFVNVIMQGNREQ